MDVMTECIEAPREQMSPHAPRILRIDVPQDKIGQLIGPGGRNIRALQDDTGADISVEDDGAVFITAVDQKSGEAAYERISAMTRDIEPGQIYTGKVVRILPFGAFVEMVPGKDALVHISELADYRVDKVEDIVSVGDEMQIIVIEVDNLGRVNASRKALLNGDADSGPREPRESRGEPRERRGRDERPPRREREPREPRQRRPRVAREPEPVASEPVEQAEQVESADSAEPVEQAEPVVAAVEQPEPAAVESPPPAPVAASSDEESSASAAVAPPREGQPRRRRRRRRRGAAQQQSGDGNQQSAPPSAPSDPNRQPQEPRGQRQSQDKSEDQEERQPDTNVAPRRRGGILSRVNLRRGQPQTEGDGPPPPPPPPRSDFGAPNR